MIVRFAARSGRAGPLAVAALGAIACTVAFFADPTRLPLPGCPFRAMTGLDCPGCGATRAAHHLLHGRIGVAADYNVLFVVLLPATLVAWMLWLFSRRPAPFARLAPALVGWSLVAVGVAFTVVRNLPWAPFAFLAS